MIQQVKLPRTVFELLFAHLTSIFQHSYLKTEKERRKKFVKEGQYLYHVHIRKLDCFHEIWIKIV